MLNLEIVLLGLALATDAAVVAFAIGLLHHNYSFFPKVLRALSVSLVFGVFQFLMLWLGSYGGFFFSFSKYGYLYQLIVAGIFFVIAAKFFYESLETEKKHINDGVMPLLVIGLATSIDALAAGMSFGTLPKSYLVATDIGFITFALCVLFYSLAQFFKNIPEPWLLRFAGIIFLGLGGHISWMHVLKGII
jgi:manganese efflux pump family protein